MALSILGAFSVCCSESIDGIDNKEDRDKSNIGYNELLKFFEDAFS